MFFAIAQALNRCRKYLSTQVSAKVIAVIFLILIPVSTTGCSKGREEALRRAANNGEIDKAKLLLRIGTDVNAKTDDGFTALMFATRYCHNEMVELLISKGADVNVKSRRGVTVLLEAVSCMCLCEDAEERHRRKEMVELFIANGADVNAKTGMGYTPIMRCAARGDAEILGILLANGSDPNARTEKGWTPLMFASREGHIATSRLLIESGADLDAKEPLGRSAMSVAANHGNSEVVRLLIEAGAEKDFEEMPSKDPAEIHLDEMLSEDVDYREQAQQFLQFPFAGGGDKKRGAAAKSSKKEIASARKKADPERKLVVARAGDESAVRLTGKAEVDPEEMVLIPAGEFAMGSPSGESYQVTLAGGGERPQHSVYVHAFYMDKYEVTNAQFCEFLNEKHNQSEGGGLWLDIADEDCLIEKRDGIFLPKSGYANHPVIEVSWYGARAYTEWAGKRLPTEAEWEYACRAGTTTRYHIGDRLTHEDANFAGTGGKDRWEKTSPVGSFDANAWGLYDMHGNVWEWCSDWYEKEYYRKSPTDNPQGPPKGQDRIVRGGGYNSDPRILRSANRGFNNPVYAFHYIGFRCARK